MEQNPPVRLLFNSLPTCQPYLADRLTGNIYLYH